MGRANGIAARQHHHHVHSDVHPAKTRASRTAIPTNAAGISSNNPTAYLERTGFDQGRYRRTALSFKYNQAQETSVNAPATARSTRAANRSFPKPPVSNRFKANPGNFGSRRGTDIDAIMLHHTAGSTASGAASALNSRGLSAHYVIDKDGTIYQMVGDEKRAYHAGGGSIRGDGRDINDRSIGIEIVNLGDGKDKYTEAQYKALEKLVPHLAQKYKIPVKNIVGHSQTGNPDRPASRPEPSRNFDWNRIRKSVNGGGAPAPNPTPPPKPKPKPRVTAPTAFLERGERGSQVKKLQNALVKLKYMTRAEVNTGPGVFGPRTEAALKKFQRDHKDVNGRQLVADGIYGQKTRGALRRALQKADNKPRPRPPSHPPNPGGKVDIDNIVGVKNNPHVTPAFKREVIAMAKRLDTKPEYLLAVMSFESGLNPKAVNPVSNATGLIQFLPSTARGLGTSTAALKNMSSVEQLKFVEKYLKPFKGRLGTLEGIYTSVLSGSPKPSPNDVLFRRGTIAYSQNKGLDFNNNGKITSGEATSAVAAKMFGGVRAVQQKLDRLGFDPKGADGVFGPNTSKAVAAFQRSRKLPVTGLLNERTGLALMNAKKPTRPDNGGNNNNAKPSGRPSVGRITSDFGPRPAPGPGASTFHRGTDFGAPHGARVQSTAPGRVIHAGALGTAGNAVIIDHGNGYQTKYFHLSKVNVRVGQRVSDSQKIGEVGNTGNSFGAHLHYEVHRNGQPVDPERFL